MLKQFIFIMVKNTEICETCENPVEKCICCDGCGHICSLDYGKPYCPVCFPEKKSDDQ